MMRCLLVAVIFTFALSPAWAEDASFDSSGVKIRYQVEGDGPPVLLIHGYMANGDLNWRVPGVTKILTPHYRVITIDNRGHGKSDKPEKVEDYGLKMVGDAIALLDHLKIDKAHFVGYSMGGMITMKAAADHPERIASAVVGGMGWLQKTTIQTTQDRRLTLPRPRSPALVACYESFPALGITEAELRAIKLPMTVVIGEQDGLYERRVKPLAQVRPDIPVVLVPNGTHINCMFKEEFKSATKEFLDKQTGMKESNE